MNTLPKSTAEGVYNCIQKILKTLRSLFMDRVQLSQGYRATTKRQFAFYYSVSRSSWYSTDRPRKDERLSWPWSHPVVFNPGPLDRESSALTTRPLLHSNHIPGKLYSQFMNSLYKNKTSWKHTSRFCFHLLASFIVTTFGGFGILKVSNLSRSASYNFFHWLSKSWFILAFCSLLSLKSYIQFINLFTPMFHFCTTWKRQKTKGFLPFSRAIEMGHWCEKGQYVFQLHLAIFKYLILQDCFISLLLKVVFCSLKIRVHYVPPANICLLKVNNGNTRKMCEICSKLTIKP